MLEDKDIDIVSIATPNHWHALAAIWAMQAGKDVYVEKPVSHNVREGRMHRRDRPQATRRICQAGTQSRSTPGMRDAMAYIHAGKIGKVNLVLRRLLQAPRQHRQGERANSRFPKIDRLRSLVRPGPQDCR